MGFGFEVDVDAADGATSSTSITVSVASVVQDSMALVTLPFESAEVPELGENVSSFSVVREGPGGGKSLSISVLPNSHPVGSVSSLHNANKTVDSHTREV